MGLKLNIGNQANDNNQFQNYNEDTELVYSFCLLESIINSERTNSQEIYGRLVFGRPAMKTGKDIRIP